MKNYNSNDTNQNTLQTQFEIQTLINKKADLQARLNTLPYDGTPEIKENQSGKYLYVRKRELGKVRSQYVDKFNTDLYDALLRYAKQAKQLRKELRQIDKALLALNYSPNALPFEVEKNLLFARNNLKSTIYDQAILEGVSTTFPQTATIIDNGEVVGMKANDIQKILNLKYAWQFVLDKNVLQSPTNYYLLCEIARIVNEGFFYNGGQLRNTCVRISGSNYIPPLPNEIDVKEKIQSVISSMENDIDKAINLLLYCAKTQIFNDGNKRSAVIFANHYLISKGGGMLVIPEKCVPEFRQLLIDYYENNHIEEITNFLKTKCYQPCN